MINFLKKLDEFGCDVLCWFGIHKWDYSKDFSIRAYIRTCIYCGKCRVYKFSKDGKMWQGKCVVYKGNIQDKKIKEVLNYYD